MNIRTATTADAQALLHIYAPYIETPITFECTLPSAEEFAGRVEEISSFYPYLVCEADGQIVGYAYAHRHMQRAAYQWNAELSIYFQHSYTSKGLGTGLYSALLALLKLQGIKTVYAGVTLPNEKSERLHSRLGFSCLGVYHRTGFKCGKWHDVAWFERALAPYDLHPQPVVPFKQLPLHRINEVLKSAL